MRLPRGTTRCVAVHAPQRAHAIVVARRDPAAGNAAVRARARAAFAEGVDQPGRPRVAHVAGGAHARSSAPPVAGRRRWARTGSRRATGRATGPQTPSPRGP